MKQIIAILLVVTLSGCQGLGDRPNNARVGLSKTLLTLAERADSLERAGTISNEKEDAIIAKLIRLNDINLQAGKFLGDPICPEEFSRVRCIDSVLFQIEQELSK
jgi:hypothetical protein